MITLDGRINTKFPFSLKAKPTNNPANQTNFINHKKNKDNL